MATLNISSRNQILGDLVRSIRVNTSITTVAPGSDIATLLEATAESLAQTQVSSLKILENSDLKSLTGEALDKKGQSIQIPNGQGGVGRIPATQATGPVTIIDSRYTKISSKLYAGKPSPFAGSTTLYVENASSFPSTGSIYIARGTVNRFEGPIPYSAVTNNTSFWTVTLTSPLSKSHLLSDQVVVAQGGDRTVNANTAVQVPANNQSPAVQYTTQTQVVIPDGEVSTSVNVICAQSGEIGNALAGTITAFGNVPFLGATVTNPTTLQSGRSSEDDESFRVRIQDYPSTLSRGTALAIKSAIVGATDTTTGRTIESANVLEPVEPGDYARVIIDDGTGLEPTFDGQPYELLLSSASGQETDFGTAQTPITPAVASGAGIAPFVLQNGMSITVTLDGVVETYTLTPSNYANLNSATAYEVVRDINAQSNLIGARTINGGTGVVFVDLSGKGEVLQVSAGTWQDVLGLPTSIIRPIYLYKNSSLLSFRGKTATLETRSFNQWVTEVSSSDFSNVPIIVDGVTQVFTILLSDFAQYGTTFNTATINQYASILKSKIAGVQFTVSGQILVLSSWQEFSAGGSLEIPSVRSDGTSVGWVGDTKVWLPTSSGGTLSDTGNPKDFQFNRFTGEITLSSKLTAGDTLEIGSRSTRAFVNSNKASSGLFSLDTQSSTIGNSRLVVGFDGNFATRTVTVPSASSLTPTVPDSTNFPHILRLTANNNSIFANAVTGDWLYLIKDASVVSWSAGVEGFYPIKVAGRNQYSSDQTANSLVATTSYTTNVLASTTLGSNLIAVTQTAHGLQTGDLITVTTIATIGGITGFYLSVTDQPIIVLDANTYSYPTGQTATSSASADLASLGTNAITVTQVNHPYQNGDFTTISTSSAIGGISGANLSETDTPVTYLTTNTWAYRASSAATASGSGTLTSTSYVADTWVEVEISSPQATAWSSLLGNPQTVSSLMPYIFRSTVLPQLVDFGNSISSATVDTVVASINSQIAGGTAVKVTPQQLTLRSNDYRTTGTVGILAVIGNASNLFSTTADSAQQAHTGSAVSGQVQGSFPVPQGISLPTSGGAYDTHTYIQVDKTFTDILDTATNPTISAPTAFVTSYPIGFQQIWLTGRERGLNTRVYNNQTSAPYTGILRDDGMIKALNTADTYQTSSNSLNNYDNYSLKLQDLPLNENDKLVAVMNLDATDSTVAIPMYKLATIQDINAITGGGAGQVISFRLSDPSDSNLPFFSPTSVYKAFDFTDFKILTQSVGLYRQDSSDTALILRSVAYGATHKFRFSIQYPQLPSQASVVISHDNNFANGVGQLNLIAQLPSGALIANSLLSQGNYHIISSASGNLFSWRITAGSLNSNSNYAVGNVLNISGNSFVAQSYQITSAAYHTSVNPTATTIASSAVVSVNYPSHGLQNNDLVTVSSATAIGGISAANLTQSNTPVTIVDANNFTYVAGASAASAVSSNLTSVTYGLVVVKSPGSGGLSAGATFNAAQAPISTWASGTATYAIIATAVNAYLSANPVATAQAIGSGASTTAVTTPTYISYPAPSAYAGSDVPGAFDWNSFDTKYSGSAGIWQYDASDASANGIKATVQTADSLFPTTTDASGTSYSPIGETVMIVPTNAKTLQKWLSFNAVSSLNILASIDRVNNDTQVQIASLSDGSQGAVQISGVSANAVATSIVGNGADNNGSTEVSILSADAKALMPNQVVHIQNTLTSEKNRPYRLTPTGSAITSANTVDITSFFRQTNSIKYIKVSNTVGRLIFYRNGMGTGQIEPLQPNNTVQMTNLGSGLVQVTSAKSTGAVGSGTLSARVGDMMYIQPSSEFPIDNWGASAGINSDGVSDGTAPLYIGFPVVKVIDSNNIVVIAPNVTTFTTTTITSATSLVFLPAIYNEKNIRTSHAEGVAFNNVINNNKMYYLVKSLGEGFVSVFIQNSSAEATDTMLLDEMSVNTDDLATFGTAFNPANQGTFKVIAHNGRNHMIIYNPEGGADEIIDTVATSNGGIGHRKWQVGPIQDGEHRQLRIVDAESVQIGDYIRISGPQANSQWLNSAFFGSFPITKIGYHAFDYSGSLPNSDGVGTVDLAKICPYVEFTMPSAPAGVLDSTNSYVDAFIIGANTSSIGFLEGTPFSAYRLVAGHGIDPSNSENSNVFLVPQINSAKMTSIYGSVLTALGKIGYDSSIHQGIDGYTVYTGPIQKAQDLIDGLPSDAINYPGVKAAGTIVEVLTPLIRSISMTLSVLPTDGVTINSISGLITATVAAYVNGLSVGASVVVSEIISTVQQLPGVLSVSVLSTTPVATNGSIVVASTEKAFILNTSDITVG